MVLSSYGEPEVETTDANYFIAIPSYHPSGVTYGGVLVADFGEVFMRTMIVA
jgi:hypothetical protein